MEVRAQGILLLTRSAISCERSDLERSLFEIMANPKTLKFLKLDPRAILPVRGSPFAAGLDLHALETVDLQPGERLAVKTGLAVQIPEGFYGRIAPRSGLAVKSGLD